MKNEVKHLHLTIDKAIYEKIQQRANYYCLSKTEYLAMLCFLEIDLEEYLQRDEEDILIHEKLVNLNTKKVRQHLM